MSVPPIHQQLHGVYPALDFGADPTGLVDSTPPLRIALATIARAGGGILVIPPGSYRLTADLRFAPQARTVIWRLPGVTITGGGSLPVTSGNSRHDLVTDFVAGAGTADGRLRVGMTLPAAAITGDIFLFTSTDNGQHTGLVNYYEADGVTVRTVADPGELARYDGERWVRTTQVSLPSYITNDALATATPTSESAVYAPSRQAVAAALNPLRVPGSALTISAGAITATHSQHDVDTEGAAATDDLDTINGGSAGALLVLRAAHADRTVVVKPDTGNVGLDADYYLDSTAKHLLLLYDGSQWHELARSHPMVRGHSYGAVLARQLGG